MNNVSARGDKKVLLRLRQLVFEAVLAPECRRSHRDTAEKIKRRRLGAVFGLIGAKLLFILLGQTKRISGH